MFGMFTTTQLAIRYFKFLLRASNPRGHGVHSPFVFDFLINVLQDKKAYQEYAVWATWRTSLLSSKTVLEVSEIGAGSRLGNFTHRSLSSLVRTAAKRTRTAKLFFRMARYYQPKTILELGTSMGLSSAFFSLACPSAAIYTIEGVESIANRAKQNFEDWRCTNIRVLTGNLDHALTDLLHQVESPGLVFMDGNHQEESTKRYFLQLLPYLDSSAMLIVDDIHWSLEMETAWAFIQSHEKVRLTIDFFEFGVVFFDSSFLEKSHFKIRY